MIRCSPGTARPPTSPKRGERQAKSSTTNEITSATAAPTTTNENGSGRSCREAIPCIGTRPKVLLIDEGQRTFKMTMVFSRWWDSTSKLPGLLSWKRPVAVWPALTSRL